MTNVTKLTNAVCRQEGTVAYHTALVRGLAPNPAQWEYRGECYDGGAAGGHCVCGHPIRYQFPVYRGGERRILGSSCVEHYHLINPEIAERMQAAFDALLAELKAKREAAKREADNAEIGELRARYTTLWRRGYDTFLEHRLAGRYVPEWLYNAIARGGWKSPDRVPEYAKAHSYKAWYNKAIERAERDLAKVGW